MKLNLSFLFCLFSYCLISSCGGNSQSNLPKESNGNESLVAVGDQFWMAKNLNVDTFHNGDKIPEAKTNIEWIEASENHQPAWCYYQNDPKNGEKYGKLYNWYAVSDPRGLAPEGWHIPNYQDWEIRIRANNISHKSLGSRYVTDGDFDGVISWWSSTEVTKDGGEAFGYFWNSQWNRLNQRGFDKGRGFHVLCVKD